MYDVVDFKDLVSRYFSSKLWLGLFIIAVIYLFFRLKASQRRAMLCALVAFLIIINAFVIRIFTSLGENSTFYRLLWAIPSAVIIGISIVDLVTVLPGWLLKSLPIAAFAIFLFFANQEEIRCKGLYFSRNAEMVTGDVISLADVFDKLRKETERNNLFIVCPSGYGMQYGDLDSELALYSGFLEVFSSNILTDDEHIGEEQLTGGCPDVQYIMTTCCSKGIDYVIVSNKENTGMAFRKAGYSPVMTTGAYDLYKCEGFSGYNMDLNRWGQTCWQTWHDENGEPTLNSAGYCTVRYTYDRWGYRNSESFYDTNGEKCDAVGSGYGYARLEQKNNSYGNIEEIRLFDRKGNPCVRTDFGYSMIRYTYSGRLLTKQCYYDENGKLFNFDFRNPRATTLFFYDDRGNCISEQYYDSEGNSSQALAGYDEIRRAYDANGHMIREGYYAGGDLRNRNDVGYAEVIRKYDQSDQLIKEEFLDASGNPVLPS